MSAPVKVAIPPPDLPWADPKTGLVDKDWYIAIIQLLKRIGGTARDLVAESIRVTGAGIVVSTSPDGDGSATVREIVGGVGILVTDGDGVSGNPTITSNFDGFGFCSSNLLADNELLGIGIFDTDISFPSADNSAIVTALIAADSNADLLIVPVVGGVDQAAVGVISFLAGGTNGAITWTPSTYTLPANTPFKIYAPSPRDISLAFLTAFVPGDL